MLWIACGLPYDATAGNWFWDQLRERDIIETNLDGEELTLFGATRDELWKQYGDLIEEVRTYRDTDLYELLAEQGFGKGTYEFETEEANHLNTWLASRPEHKAAWDAQVLREKIRVWRLTHPAWVEYNRRYDELRQEEVQQTFVGRGLAKPGTLIEMADGSRHLIGSINPNKGICDDCVAFNGADIVVRYAVLVEWPFSEGD